MGTTRKVGTFFVNGKSILNANRENKTITLPPIESFIASIDNILNEFKDSIIPFYPHLSKDVIGKMIEVMGWLENGGKTIDGTLYQTFTRLPKDKNILDATDLFIIKRVTNFTDSTHEINPDDITYLNSQLDRYSTLLINLINPDTRTEVLISGNTDVFYTTGEYKYDSYVITNNYDIEKLIKNLTDGIQVAEGKIDTLEADAANMVTSFNTINNILKQNFLDMSRMLFDFKDILGDDFTPERLDEVREYFNTDFVDFEGNINKIPLFTTRFTNLCGPNKGYKSLISSFNSYCITGRNDVISALTNYDTKYSEKVAQYPIPEANLASRYIRNVNYPYVNPEYILRTIRYNNIPYISNINADNGGGFDYNHSTPAGYIYSALKIVPSTRPYGWYEVGDKVASDLYGISSLEVSPPIPYRPVNYYNWSTTPNISITDYVLENTDIQKTTPNIPHKVNLLKNILTCAISTENEYSNVQIQTFIDGFNKGVYGFCNIESIWSTYGANIKDCIGIYVNTNGVSNIRYTHPYPDMVPAYDVDYDLVSYIDSYL